MIDPISRGQRRPDSRTAPPDGRPHRLQPKWRKDFPIDTGQDEYVSRRELVKFMVLTSGAFAVGQFWLVARSLIRRGRTEPPALPVAEIGELPVGGAKTFRYPEGSPPRLLVRLGEDDFVAYDQQCTHLLCPVVPAIEQGKLHCPCHHGWFDLRTGEPTAGPPRRALPKVLVERRGDRVWATGLEEPQT
ncbi:MAG TPA: Rieske (2Fe-2S) protein [Vulgatibacter sp.]